MAIAFDAATGAIEVAGDGTLTLSHTAAGTNRAAFIFMGIEASTPGTLTAAYAGNTPTTINAFNGPFGSQKAAAFNALDAQMSTGAQTVSSVATGVSGAQNQVLGVISLNGVDQTTPQSGFQTAQNSAGTPSVTVTGVGATDLVLDGLFCFDATNPTEGANQTERVGTSSGSTQLSMSTQAGADGGAMTYSTIPNEFMYLATAYKASAGGGGAVQQTLSLTGVGS